MEFGEGRIYAELTPTFVGVESPIPIERWLILKQLQIPKIRIQADPSNLSIITQCNPTSRADLALVRVAKLFPIDHKRGCNHTMAAKSPVACERENLNCRPSWDFARLIYRLDRL